jgi:predicted ATPase
MCRHEIMNAMNPGISSLTIKGFRSIRQLEVNDLGRVNLITGRNNTGKASVLEALSLLMSGGSHAVLNWILWSREEISGESQEKIRPRNIQMPPPVVSFFPGSPPISEICDPIVIVGNGGSKPFSLKIYAGYWVEEGDASGSKRKFLRSDEPNFAQAAGNPALEISNGAPPFYLPLNQLQPKLGESETRMEPRAVPFRFLNPYCGWRTAELEAEWDRIALSDKEKEVVEALKILDPGITGVSMVGGGDGANQVRHAIVRSKAFSHPVPLRSFGDGMNKVFAIMLYLVNAKDGFLFIDEFENGLHHTIQLDLWRIVFRLSASLNIQVFATSHSWDAVETFQKALAEDPSAGLLFRLTRKGESLFTTTFREDELAIATREYIEVR